MSATPASLRHVTLELSRRGCPTEVDAIDLNIGDDPDGKAVGGVEDRRLSRHFQGRRADRRRDRRVSDDVWTKRRDSQPE